MLNFAFLKLITQNTNMKTKFLKIFAVIAIISFASCADKAKEAETTSEEEAAVAEAAAIIYKAKAEDFQKATHRIYHSKKYPSKIEFTSLKQH